MQFEGNCVLKKVLSYGILICPTLEIQLLCSLRFVADWWRFRWLLFPPPSSKTCQAWCLLAGQKTGRLVNRQQQTRSLLQVVPLELQPLSTGRWARGTAGTGVCGLYRRGYGRHRKSCLDRSPSLSLAHWRWTHCLPRTFSTQSASAEDEPGAAAAAAVYTGCSTAAAEREIWRLWVIESANKPSHCVLLLESCFY